MTNHSDLVVSLFAGAGGFSLGFAKAGMKPAFGAELNTDACATYQANIESPCHNIDLSTVEPKYFKKLIGNKEPLAIIGGPPCQGFSTAGMRNSSDPRNKLIFNYLRIVAEVQPRWFIFENVEGLLTSANGQAVASLVREFLSIGYCVRLEKVNLAGFGVPQTRKRVLIVGNRLGLNFHFPVERYSYDSGKAKKRTESPFGTTLLDAISGLGKPTTNRGLNATYVGNIAGSSFDEQMREGNPSGLITEHFDNTSAEDAQRFALLKCGNTMKDLPEQYWHDSFRKRAFRRVQDGTPTEKRGGAPSGIKRLHGDKQSLTITGAASREFIHPTLNRPLTIRECARLQSFPDSYQFHGIAASVIQQIGNAVPPIGSAVFAEHLASLDGQFGGGLTRMPTYASPRLLGFVLTEANGMSEALKSTHALLHKLIQTEFKLG